MDKKTIGRLLDEGLKNYSRVQPPGSLSETEAGRARRVIAPAAWRWWLWAPAPLAVAALLAAWVLVPRHQTAPAPPPALSVHMERPSVAGETPALPAATVRERTAPRHPRKTAVQASLPARSIRVLSPEELASIEIPADLFPRQSRPQPVGEIVIPSIAIREVTIPDIETRTMEDPGSEHSQTR